MSWSTSSRVRQKTIAAVGRLDVEDPAQRGRLVRPRRRRRRSAGPGAPRPAAACSRPICDAHRVAQVPAGHARRSGDGMVAENSTVCRCSGASRPGSPRCPRRSPCRASRRPRRARRWRSVAQPQACPGRCGPAPGPGVATTTSTPALQGRAAAGRSAGRRRSAAPGRRGPGRSGGTPRTPGRPARGSARGPAPPGRRRSGRAGSRCSSGRANAAVLPVPVAAWPSRSRPASSGGIASRWIGVGSS